MTDMIRRDDTARNLILNRAVDDLDRIVNSHDPETDVPISQGVWDRLDRLALEIEARAPLAEALAVPTWQPIETAPASNGSKAFLAYVRGHGSVVCHRIGNTIYSNSNQRREIPGAILWMPLDEINEAALRAIGERGE